jgi:hypothetical protein
MRSSRLFILPKSLVVLLIVLAFTLNRPSLVLGDNFEEFFDKDLFLERVTILTSVKRGDPEAEVVKALGQPQAQGITPEGHKEFTYRVRCYAGLEPSSRWPRHSLTYEIRIIFNQEGRVSTIQTKP